MPTNGTMMPAEPIDQQIAAQQRRGADRPVRDAAQRQRDQRTMISALKITADRIALSGLARRMMLSASSCG